MLSRRRRLMQKSSTFYSRPVGKNEKRLDSSVNVRYLFVSGELEGGGRRATDPNWSLKVFNFGGTLPRRWKNVVNKTRHTARLE